jgi:hypothetical protein
VRCRSDTRRVVNVTLSSTTDATKSRVCMHESTPRCEGIENLRRNDTQLISEETRTHR